MSQLVSSLICFVCVIYHVTCDTVFFTNSQSRLENSYSPQNGGDNLKTYQLEVPGSSPITIIEADSHPEENGRYAKLLRDRDDEFSNERRTKDYVVPGSTHESGKDKMQFHDDKCHGEFCSEANVKTVYSPDLLNKFLQEYAERIKNADQKTKEKLQQMEITTTKDNYVGGISYEKKKVSGTVDIQLQKDGNRRYWDEVDTKRHKHPYDDPEGWVALEAVPWSRSKISKWQATAQKVSKPNNNYHSFDDADADTIESSNGYNNDRYKPESQFQKPHHSTYEYSSKPISNKFTKPFPETSFDDDYVTNAPPRPSWQQPNKGRPYQNIGYDMDRRPNKHSNCDHNGDEEIEEYDAYNRRVSNQYYDKDLIVDERPNDFPPSSQEYTMPKYYNKKPENDVSQNNDFRKFRHPSNHPSNGNGQWVLLSTTKGYKYPKAKSERSLNFYPKSITSRRSIRLTVLPAVDGSQENMTSSHGGLLEIEPSFHSVEESKRIYDQIQAVNDKTVKKKPTITKSAILTTNPTPDASAVVAAVGAGLVPATVGMIMPMMLGRKKRSIYTSNPFDLPNVTQIPSLNYESVLQKTA